MVFRIVNELWNRYSSTCEVLLKIYDICIQHSLWLTHRKDNMKKQCVILRNCNGLSCRPHAPGRSWRELRGSIMKKLLDWYFAASFSIAFFRKVFWDDKWLNWRLIARLLVRLGELRSFSAGCMQRTLLGLSLHSKPKYVLRKTSLATVFSDLILNENPYELQNFVRGDRNALH